MHVVQVWQHVPTQKLHQHVLQDIKFTSQHVLNVQQVHLIVLSQKQFNVNQVITYKEVNV